MQPPLLVDDDQRADAGILHATDRLGYGAIVADGVRVGDDSVLRPLDGGDLANLRRDVAGPKPAIDHADAALLREHDRHRGPRDGIHVGRDQRTLQRHVLREGRRQIDDGRVATRNDAKLRSQQKIIERAAAHELQKVHGAILPGTYLPRLGGIELRDFLSRGEGETVRAIV